jgi:hypothetical protein
MTTAAQRALNARQRDREQNVKQINLRVPAAFVIELRRVAIWLRDNQPRELTGLVVRNRKGQVLTMALDQMPPADA